MIRRIYDIIYYIFTKEHSETISLIPLEEEWITILSECELKIAEVQRNQVRDELEAIRTRSTKLTYKDLIKDINVIFTKYHDEVEIIRDYQLLSDLKNSLFKDVFYKSSETSLNYLRTLYNDIDNIWYPTEYERNILGELIAIANQFCPEKLNIRGLAQTIMAVHLSLIQTINSLRKILLTHEESNKLLILLVETVIPLIIESWIDTVKRSRGSSVRLGQLPSKWQEEQIELKRKLEKIKAEGKIDAKFGEDELDPVRRKYLQERFGVSNDKTSSLIMKEDIVDVKVEPNKNYTEIKQKLETSLNFRYSPSKSKILISEMSININEVKKKLEETLKFRHTSVIPPPLQLTESFMMIPEALPGFFTIPPPPND